MDFPKTIYMNFSDKLDSQTDVLGHGTFRYLTDNIRNFYNQNQKVEYDRQIRLNELFFLRNENYVNL